MAQNIRRNQAKQQQMPQATNTGDNQQLEKLLIQYLAASRGQSDAGTAQKSTTANETQTINLTELFWRIMSKLHWVVLGAVLGTVLMAAYAYGVYVPQYSSTSKLYIVNNSNSVINMSDLQIGTALTTDYQEVFKTHEVGEMAAKILLEEYGLDGFDYRALQKMLTVSNPQNSRVLYLTAVHTDREIASEVADAFALAGQRFITERMRTDEPTSFSIAMIPSNPSTRSRSTYVILGFAVGTLIALAIITFLFVIDDKPRTAEDIYQVAGIPTLGTLPITEADRKSMNRSKQRRDRRNRKNRKGRKKA